jgi:hypothetical protein
MTKLYRYISEKSDVQNFDFKVFQETDKYLDIVVNNKEYHRIKKENFDKELQNGRIRAK